MKKNIFKATFLTLFILLSACASKNKIVEKIPVTEIKRPYTLPDGAKSWSVTALPFFNTVFINPFYWEQSLSDDWTLIWGPLPLGFKYQAFNTENSRLGITAYTILISTIGSLDYRYKLNPLWALDMGYTYNQSNLLFFGVNLTSHSLYFSPIYQFTDQFSGQAGLAYISGNTTVGGGVIGAIFNSTTTLTTNFSGLQKTINAQYSFNNQWNIKAGATSTQLNGYNEYFGYNFVLTHFWD